MLKKNLYVYAGFAWCIAFSVLTFYWSNGGMLGVRTLGGIIYRKALEGDEEFLLLVRITGFLKFAAGLFILLLLRDWQEPMKRILYFLALIGGVFLFLYGFANFSTLVLNTFNILNLELDGYSLKWRLFFWEPFWMAGGLLFIQSARRFKDKALLHQ
ncbi:DUF3995 domain-containing protein [Mesobacillus jeotgali]|uniref:DUF3995 domain-containing protein n=1 Tax=Mesobacillus jeotgali TaxID=129985 RepID=UPI0009A8BA18|nr:DUF3995 domain-containing protein [Mesobacillus jeotgali]